MTDKESILKEHLIKIKNNNYLLENPENYFPLGLKMLNTIGSPDPELRDELIYGTLFHWITGNRFTFQELIDLLNISLDSSHIFYKLGERDEDAVFKRAFSVLIAALIIHEHRKDNFLSEKVLYKVKDKLIRYMLNEQDVRGYVDKKGWAHSAAHTADALDELAQCLCFNTNDLMDILNSVKHKVCTEYYVYVDEENERMTTVVENCFNRKILSNLEIITWLQGFKAKKQNCSYIENFHLRVNINGFLRSLYFRLLEQKDSIFIIEEIKRILSKL